MKVINMLIENRETIAGLIILIVFCVQSVREFMLLDGTAKREKVLHWLEYQVSDAESYFGESTGELKLRKTYSAFIKEFPVCATFVSYERFKDLVDEALEWMREQIAKNGKIKAAIYN